MNPFKKRKPVNTHAIILDTSGIIDGRILAIAKSGFVPPKIIAPQFVIAELQYLADTGDSMKRERARFGLDVIRELQDSRRTTVVIAREQFKHIREVDDKLIALAKQYGAMLYTTDYNLNKVAQIEGVTVLNVNELAQALRPPRLPGERLEIKITQVGQDKTQGVGYLEDGTMVVVEGASKLLGKKVLVQFSRMLQTQAGKMMFAVLHSGGEVHHAHQQHQPTPQVPPAQPVKKLHPQGSSYHSELHHKPHVQPNAAQHKPAPVPPIAKPKNKWPAKRKKSPEDSLIAAVQNQK